jgi:[acyl-carrier-protein] S-malonyltransferase
MGRDFYDMYEEARDAFAEADEALGFKLSKTVFEGPGEELVKTAVTQPAILVTSVAVMRAAEREFGGEFAPAYYAGHSLGEYTALVASGVLSLRDAVRLVRRRGSLMQDAVPLGEGAMAAVLGLGLDEIKSVCDEAAQGGICGPANVNSPGQIVISGSADAVRRAEVIAKSRGASKFIPLKVSAPFHCALMRPVADKLREAFGECTWNTPKAPIMANVDASPKSDPDAIKRALGDQTYMPVLWADGVEAMTAGGVRRFVEFGPGSVLAGLIKRTVKGCPAVSVNKVSDIQKAAGLLKGDLL